MSMEPAISQNMLRAMRRASSARVMGEAPSVRLRKIGAVAAGLRMGSMVASTKRKPLVNASANSIVMVGQVGAVVRGKKRCSLFLHHQAPRQWRQINPGSDGRCQARQEDEQGRRLAPALRIHPD